jgi:SsuE family FMN reductase
MASQDRAVQIVGISGSPSPNSRSRLLILRVLAHLAAHSSGNRQGIGDGQLIDLSGLSADALLGRTRNQALDEAIQQVCAADILVVGTPVYRASYAGQLKVFFDLFPQDALRGRVVGLVATGAGLAHQLVIDHGLRPLVASLGGLSAATGIYVADAQFPDKAHLPVEIDDHTSRLARELAALAGSLQHTALALDGQER